MNNNDRRDQVDERAVELLGNSFLNVWHQELDGQQTGEVWQQVLARHAYDQMPYQIPLWMALVRTLCLFGDDDRFGPIVVEGHRWEECLGVTLPDYLLIGFGMYTAAVQNGGSVTRSSLLDCEPKPAFGHIPVEQALTVVDRWMARPVKELSRST